MGQVGGYDLLPAPLLPFLLVGSLCSQANRVMIQLLVKGESFLHRCTCTKCGALDHSRKKQKRLETSWVQSLSRKADLSEREKQLNDPVWSGMTHELITTQEQSLADQWMENGAKLVPEIRHLSLLTLWKTYFLLGSFKFLFWEHFNFSECNGNINK